MLVEGVVLDGVVPEGVVDEAPPDPDDGVVEEDDDEEGPIVDAPDVVPVFSPGVVVDVVVEVELVPLPLPEDGVVAGLEDVELAAQPVKQRAVRTMV